MLLRDILTPVTSVTYLGLRARSMVPEVVAQPPPIAPKELP